ncbi:hypothetical protein RRG08_061822 [Elysia crispata]|uniref:Uncharacterized protein n=1 Tax=Elysia crispata TaxID=231223 RepID=A0AAE1A293_9GAST|nr:hypothetical protein RRG08_061822 [Elysia crispata]
MTQTGHDMIGSVTATKTDTMTTPLLDDGKIPYFGTVKLLKVKVHGKPRNVQTFTKQGKRRYNMKQLISKASSAPALKKRVLEADITVQNHGMKTDDMLE